VGGGGLAERLYAHLLAALAGKAACCRARQVLGMASCLGKMGTSGQSDL